MLQKRASLASLISFDLGVGLIQEVASFDHLVDISLTSIVNIIALELYQSNKLVHIHSLFHLLSVQQTLSPDFEELIANDNRQFLHRSSVDDSQKYPLHPNAYGRSWLLNLLLP
jgi:hypothetical protein